MVLFTIAVLNLKELQPFEFSLMITFSFTRSVMISANDSLVVKSRWLVNEVKNRMNIWALVTKLFYIVDNLKYTFFRIWMGISDVILDYCRSNLPYSQMPHSVGWHIHYGHIHHVSGETWDLHTLRLWLRNKKGSLWVLKPRFYFCFSWVNNDLNWLANLSNVLRSVAVILKRCKLSAFSFLSYLNSFVVMLHLFQSYESCEETMFFF